MDGSRKLAARSVLSIGLVVCQIQLSATSAAAGTSIDTRTFHACVDREAKAALTRAIDKNKNLAIYGYPLDAANTVIGICNPQLPRESLNDFWYTSNPGYLYVNQVLDALQQAARNEIARKETEEEHLRAERDAPRLKAEKDEEDAIGAAYHACLIRHVKILSINSGEPAETIVQATFASCDDEAKALLAVHQKHNDCCWSQETMDVIQRAFTPHLLLEVIKARAQPTTPQEITPTKPETPL